MDHTGAAPTRIGAIEAGGTKFVIAVATADVGDGSEIIEQATIPTEEPAATIGACIDILAAHQPLAALGVGTFGPVDLSAGATFGTILSSPKQAWNGCNLIDAFTALNCPIALDTDVNAAALAEANAAAVARLAYFTVGTGVGGGLVIDGATLAGKPHPEMGHASLQRRPGDTFAGTCPYHGACVEGLASGPALEARYGLDRGTLAEATADPALRDEVVDIAAYYLGQLAANTRLSVAPERVVFGGGVMQIPGLFHAVRDVATERVGGYGPNPTATMWLTEPLLGTRSGLTGALMLAERARQQAAVQ